VCRHAKGNLPKGGRSLAKGGWGDIHGDLGDKRGRKTKREMYRQKK